MRSRGAIDPSPNPLTDWEEAFREGGAGERAGERERDSGDGARGDGA